MARPGEHAGRTTARGSKIRLTIQSITDIRDTCISIEGVSVSGTISADALGRLRAAKAAMQKDAEMRHILESRDSVVDRYGPQFQPGQIEQIDEKVLRSF